MVDRLLSPEQVAEIMSVSKRSAYDHMHRMPYMESPLRVRERDLREYIESRMVYPMPQKKRRRA